MTHKGKVERHILRRMIAGFLLFALLAMMILTITVANRIRGSNRQSLYQFIHYAASAAINDDFYMGFYDDPSEELPQITLGRMQAASLRENLPFASKLFFCDANYDVLAESGPLVQCSYQVPSANSNHHWTTYSPLVGLSDEQLLEIFQRSEEQRKKELSNDKEAIGYQFYAVGHWEGWRLIVSQLIIEEETRRYQSDGMGYGILDSRPIMQYDLATPQADDQKYYCTVCFEGRIDFAHQKFLYDRHIQKELRTCQAIWEQVRSEYPFDGIIDGMIMTHNELSPIVWAQDICVITTCKAEVEGQPLQYIVATGRAYPILQAMQQLWSIYIAILLIALAFAGAMGYQFTKLGEWQKRLDDSRQALLVAVAHELKNPLSVIKTYSEGLLENIAAEKRDDYLQTIIDETDQMDQMIVELLSLTRLTSDGETMHKEDILLEDLIDAVVARYAPQIRQQQIILQVQCAPLATVCGDRRLLEQALANLLANAITYTPTAGTITIAASEKSLSVDNEGVTIDDEDWAHLFEPFYKVDSSRTNSGGVGLGLAIVQAICQLHGMTVDGHNLPNGVRFVVHFVSE